MPPILFEAEGKRLLRPGRPCGYCNFGGEVGFEGFAGGAGLHPAGELAPVGFEGGFMVSVDFRESFHGSWIDQSGVAGDEAGEEERGEDEGGGGAHDEDRSGED